MILSEQWEVRPRASSALTSPLPHTHQLQQHEHGFRANSERALGCCDPAQTEQETVFKTQPTRDAFVVLLV